uniref:SFRICE_034491 n=1 Tax=Spodoptera frugiperda TaxID=7108 RepID=A0A2H1WDF5_SPOFR
MLFTEVMRPNEALMIIGAERYSKYVGYGHSFQFAGEHRDTTPRDSSARRRCAVLAIDAVPYSGLAQEFRREAITRELNKAWVGVSFDTDVSSDRLQYPGVATGNWGCGAFGGTPHLKSLVQLMACCQARRPMAYYTFGDTQLRDDIANMYNLLARHNVTVGQLYRYIVRFAQENNVLLTRFYTYLEKVLKENKESSQNSSDNMMDISITESTAGPVVIEDGSTDNSPDLFSQDEMDESLLEVTIQSERIASKTDSKKETPKITRKAETNTNKQVTPIQSTKHLTEQQIEQHITQQIDQEVAQLVEQQESSKSPPTADTKKMSLLDAVTIMDQDDKHEQHTSPATNKRFSLRSDTKPAMNTESESTPERKKGTPKKKITDYFSTRNK